MNHAKSVSDSAIATKSLSKYAQFVKQLIEESQQAEQRCVQIRQLKRWSDRDKQELTECARVIQENKYRLDEAKPMEAMKEGDWVQNGTPTPGQIIGFDFINKKPLVNIRWWQEKRIDSKSPQAIKLLPDSEVAYVWDGQKHEKLIRKCDRIECEDVEILKFKAEQAKLDKERAKKLGQPSTILDRYQAKITYCQKRIKFLEAKEEISQVNNEQLFLSLYAKEKKSRIQKIAIASIQRDKATQQRTNLNHETVTEYAEAMKAGEKFPPVKLIYDGTNYYLYDGFHTTEAAYSNGETHIEAEVTEGSLRDAILASVGVNSNHGLRRSNADKRKAVMTLLEDEEWSKWSNREIARRCKVTEGLVRKIKKENSHCVQYAPENLTGINSSENQRTYQNKRGSITTMNTENIGKSNPDRLNSNSYEKRDIEQESAHPIQFQSNVSKSQIKFLPNQVLQLKLTDIETAEAALKALNHQYCIIKGECDIGNGYWVEFPEASQKRVVMADDLKPVEEVSLTITMSPKGYLEMLATFGNRENFRQAIMEGRYNPYG